MTIDPRFIISQPLNQYFVDKDSGLPLSGGTISFFRDDARNVPKSVYQLTGAPPNYQYVELPNPVTLSSSGTVLNESNDNEIIYFFPFDANGDVDLYYIECRNSGGVLQWTREGWPNVSDSGGNVPIVTTDLIFSNQIANPQFTKTFLNSGVNQISFSSAVNKRVPIAPDWFLVCSGTGTVDIEVIPVSGNENIVNSPPFVLDITAPSGITSCLLEQRLAVNPGIWASTSGDDLFLAGAVTVRNENVGETSVDLFYRASNSIDEISIVNATFDNSAYVELKNTTVNRIPPSTDTALGKNGFADIFLRIQPNSRIRVTSIQVTPTKVKESPEKIQYDIRSANRDLALMGDYFIPGLEARQQPNILVGWDFSLNPAQFGVNQTIDANPKYIWDQTIAGRAGSDFTVTRDSNRKSMVVTSTGANSSFFVAQYLTSPDTGKLTSASLSVNVSASKIAGGDDVTCRVYMFGAPSATSFPVLPAFVGTIGTDGIFSKGVNDFVEITRKGLPTAKGVLGTSALNEEFVDLQFNNFNVYDSVPLSNSASQFCILVAFEVPDASTQIAIDSINLTSGDIASRPAPKSLGETLEDCKSYYESNYPLGISEGGATTDQQLFYRDAYIVDEQSNLTGLGNTFVLRAIVRPFSIGFKSKKINPQFRVYNKSGTGNTANLFYNYSGAQAAPSTQPFSVAQFSTSPSMDYSFTGTFSPANNNITFEVGNLLNYIVSIRNRNLHPVATDYFSDSNTNPLRIYAYLGFNYVIDARLGQF